MKINKRSHKPTPDHLSIRLDDLLPKNTVTGGKSTMIFGAQRQPAKKVASPFRTISKEI